MVVRVCGGRVVPRLAAVSRLFRIRPDSIHKPDPGPTYGKHAE